MQNRLRLCSVYLKEVESKLIRLQDSVGDDPQARAKIAEALCFVGEAHNAVSQTQHHIVDLQRARTRSAKRQSA